MFDAFLHSFTTYRSLLLRIKQEYDVALDDALASLYDNVHMKAELAVVDERMVRGAVWRGWLTGRSWVPSFGVCCCSLAEPPACDATSGVLRPLQPSCNKCDLPAPWSTLRSLCLDTQATAVQQARARAMEDASAVRKELQDQLNMEESKALQVRARCPKLGHYRIFLVTAHPDTGHHTPTASPIRACSSTARYY